MNKIRFTKVRDVKSPSRGNVGDAGIDFYTPVDLTLDDLVSANKDAENIVVSTEASGFGMSFRVASTTIPRVPSLPINNCVSGYPVAFFMVCPPVIIRLPSGRTIFNPKI